jgi:hydrogenase expression/formation protein HypC
MCIAVPGRVVSIEGNYARVDYRGNTVKVNIGIVEPNVGDYVLVHAGCAIEVMDKDRADELTELFEELERI